MKKFLEDLAELLEKNNVMICSTKGSVSFTKDCHESTREKLETRRSQLGAYDLQLELNETACTKPLVLMSEFADQRERTQSVDIAILRHLKDGLHIPSEWIAGRNELITNEIENG